MTTFEHAMLGVCGTLATGLHRKYGWRLPAIAGIAALSPDWDGLTYFFSIQLFDQSHRVWGHNLCVGTIVGLAIGVFDAKWDLVGRGYRLLQRLLRQPLKAGWDDVPNSHSAWVWCVVAMIAALSHLPADMVVSGGEGLTDWDLQILWPFSKQGFVYPLVRWGDVGASLVFVTGMFAMLRWRNRLQSIAATTLVLVVTYLLARGLQIRG